MIDAPADLLADLAALLKERVGLNVRPDGHAALRLALSARFESPAPPTLPPPEYLALLRSENGDEELRRLLPLVTVGKTSFFRDERQFEALAELMPGLLARARAAGRPVAAWSAGCATGEEPWSIAMTAAQAGAAAGDLELLATDLNPEAVAFAAAGAFPARRVRGVPPTCLEAFFEREGDVFLVRPRLRALLSGVRTHNLVSSAYPRPLSGAWDVIFCRNVIIYFDTPTVQAVLGRMLASLAPGGWLFLGYSESLFRLFDGFQLTEVAGAFLYRRPEGQPSLPAPPPASAGSASPRYTPRPVHHTLPSAPREPARPSPRPHFSPQEVLDAAAQLLAAGRFAAAKDRLLGHLAGGGEDLAIRLTLAYLEDILKEQGPASESYQAALAQEPLSAEAHLLYGIHLLGRGQADDAAQEIGRALFLDPDLAMGHYFLGRCREMQRDPPRARLSYRNAIEACARLPGGHRQTFLGHYPDLPDDGMAFARAAEYALRAL